MDSDNTLTTRQICEWMLRRNPSYLISACLMAIGTRLLLVGPSAPAGDIKLILATLVILQLYEWTVAAILLVLFRAARSPEDRPSLLLVATAFWTGPMAATIEMTALRPSLGTCLAAGACLIAVSELRLCVRSLQLQLSAFGQLVACGCVALLVVVAPLLKIPYSNSGWNELYLYATWWLFAGLVSGILLAIRSYRNRSSAQAGLAPSSPWKQEAWFLTMTVAATCVHLIGMNYGFFCHASYFYASPLIVALSVVGFAMLSPTFSKYCSVLTLLAAMPGIAILLALQPFDADVPMGRMPPWLRDPLIALCAIAGAAWWFGYWRHRMRILLHLGCGALALAALRAIHGPFHQDVDVGSINVSILMYGSAAYLIAMACLLRVRWEAFLATAIQFLATALIVRQQTPAAGLIVCLAGGWSAWIALHVAFHRPWMLVRLMPISFLAMVPWMLDASPRYRVELELHAAAMVLVLFVAGHSWRWTRYRLIAGLVAAGHVIAFGADRTMRAARPEAAMLVLAGFAVLATGALISWHKRHLLSAIAKKEAYIEPELPIQ